MREVIRTLILLALVTLVATAIGAFLAIANAHDWKHPNFDEWYDSLKRPGVGQNAFGGAPPCCSKTDCHETEAEIRGKDWWARLGLPQTREDGHIDWELGAWVAVPADKVLHNTSNPTGNAVICHQVIRLINGELNPQATIIWCFIPPTES